MLNSTVIRINIENRNGKKSAVSVEFIYKNKKYKIRAKKEVILAGGAVNSPQLLLLSGIGPKEELDRVGIQQMHQLPGVGKNLHNHVAFYLTYQLNRLKDINDLDWATALEYILYRKGPMSSTGISQITARLNSKYAEASGLNPDLQIFFSGFLAHCAESGEVNATADSKEPDAPKRIVLSPVALHPKSRGYLTLKSSNPLEYPLLYPNYLAAPEDAKVLVDGIRVIQKLANTKVFKNKYGMELEKEDYGDCEKLHKFDSDDYWICAVRYYTGPENHQAGSCKMGPNSDHLAVVNSELQVYGISNLRIMDASIMPTVVSGNTHATVVMIAEKGIDAVKKKWLGSVELGNRHGTGAHHVAPQAGASYPYPGYQDRNHGYSHYGGQNFAKKPRLFYVDPQYYYY